MESLLGMLQAGGAFGGVHFALLGASAVLGIFTVWGMRKLRGSQAEVRVTVISGWLLLAGSVVYGVWILLPQNWDLQESLPLHFSDILRIIVAIALIWRPRWAIGVTYYWGLTLNTQALLTPHHTMLSSPSVVSMFYWVLHIMVLLAPLALIWGAGYKPRWKDFFITYALTVVWAAVTMSVNAILGTNYAFLNRAPQGWSLIDLLGPWPVYVVWLAVLAAAIWALMTLPWTRESHPRGEVRKRRSTSVKT